MLTHDLVRIGLAFCIGCGLGFMVAGLGLGGAMILVPILILGFDAPTSIAVGTALATVGFASLFGAIRHRREGRVHHRVAFAFGVTTMLAAWLGANLHGLVPERLVLGLLSAALSVASIQLMRRAPRGSDRYARIATWKLATLGIPVGVVAGITGVSGGFMIVPVLVWGAGLELRHAVGTTVAITTVTCFAGAVPHALRGHVDLALTVALVMGTAFGAPLGATLSGRLPERPARIAFACVLLVVAFALATHAFR